MRRYEAKKRQRTDNVSPSGEAAEDGGHEFLACADVPVSPRPKAKKRRSASTTRSKDSAVSNASTA